MKPFIRYGILSSLLLGSPSFALNPVGGFYGGILAEISHGPSDDQIYFSESGLLFEGTVDYSPISGGGGGFLGYKYSHFRIEGEVLYNRISTGPLTVGSCVIESPNVLTPTGLCPAATYDSFQTNGLGYSGSSSALYGLINLYWDFFTYEGETFFVPYVGIGFGKAQVKNSSNFVYTSVPTSRGQSITNSSTAMQGILGLSYYMDDYTWVTMDYRYLTTNNLPEFQNKSYNLNTLNFTVGFAFDKGAL